MKEFVRRPPWKGLSRSISYADKQRIWGLVDYEPHSAQQEIHESEARFKVVSCGRRFGKTEGIGVHEILPVLLLGGWVWNLGPDYATAGKLWREVLKRFQMNPELGRLIVDAKEAEGKELLTLKSGGLLAAKSSASLNRGEGLDLIVFDEAGHEPDPAPWRYALRPSLMDREGGAIFISTPDGMTWFKDFWDKGQDGSMSEGRDDEQALIGRWESWRFSSYDNPYLSKAEIDELVEDATQDEIDQEIFAKFLEGIGGVFRGYDEASTAIFRKEPEPGHSYVLAIDPATVKDFCGINVFDITDCKWAHAERFTQVDWDTIRDRAVSLSEEWGYCPAIIDATNQSAFAQQLAQEINWAMVIPFIFTAQSKANLIRDYALAIARKEIQLPKREQPKSVGSELLKVAKMIHSEHGWFRYEKNPLTGHIKMQAPVGKTDDMVMAGALGYHFALHYGNEAPRPNIENPDDRASFVGVFGRPVEARAGFKGKKSTSPFANRRR